MGLHPLFADILERQLRALWRIRVGMLGFLLAVILAGFLLPAQEGWLPARTARLCEIGLGGLSVALLLAALIALRRLGDPKRVARARADELLGYGLPERLDLALSRQAVFLTRASAGWVLAWGLSTSAGISGLVCRMLGSPMWVVVLFFAVALGALLVLRLPVASLRRGIENLDGN